MAIKVTCPSCGKLLSIPDEYYETDVKCPVCETKFNPSEMEKKQPASSQAPHRPGAVVPPHRRYHEKSRFLAPVRHVRRSATSAGKRRLLSAIGRRNMEEAAMEAELSRATKIQFNLLPERIPNIRGFDTKVYYRSAKEVGGDYYDFIAIDRENLGIVVADVSGKGVPAGLVMAMARTTLRLVARGNPSARDTIVKVNRLMAKDIKNVMFLTMLYMILNVKTSTLQVVNAGHNPLILWRDGSHRLLTSHGIAMGIDYGPIFEKSLKEDLIQIQTGDRIIAYTDGVVECMNEKDEEFGEERFLDLITRLGD